MSDYEKLGSFYLGRQFDLAAGEVSTEKVLYDANDLTTHAVCVGMTGSGKTGLCLSLIEEAALDGIPVIAIDPKGDLGNLLLAFPDLRPSDFEPWIDPTLATQQGITPAQLAEQTAATWKKGLADWDEGEERVRKYAAVDKVIYTPGSTAGLPLTVLKSFHAPPAAIVDDVDTYNDLLQSTTQGVLALVGIDADPVQSREAILISKVLDHAWRAGRSLDLPTLIHDIQKPPFTKVGIVDIENFLPSKNRMDLGMKINNLLASPSFANWLQGDSLDVESLLYTADKKPRLSILSIAHLNDAERMFFVTILLNEVLGWMRTQPGTGSLRAILYMDEVFGYFPPSANPPSKRPMLTLLKQARAFGLGVVLATQNPVDLDYKGLSNAGTWFLGRLQTERDKLRVLEGLEGASAQAGGNFNRAQMDTMLSGLRSRVFLVNNVHKNKPQVMHTRWAMSYLRGPLTRDQIRVLMKDRKTASAIEQPLAVSTPTPSRERHDSLQPILSGEIVQKFWPLDGKLAEGSQLEYRPALFAQAKLHYVQASSNLDLWQECAVVQPIHGKVSEAIWDAPLVFEQLPHLDDASQTGGQFATLPTELAQEKNYRTWERELKDWLYQTQRYVRWHESLTDSSSNNGESEEEFRLRIAPAAQVAEKARLEREFNTALDKTKDAIAKAEYQVSEHKWWWFSSFWRVIEVVFSRLLGGSSRKQLVTKTSTNQMSRGRRQYADAKEELARQTEKLAQLESEYQHQLATLETNFHAETLVLEKTETSARKGDTDVDRVSLVWLPWQIEADGRAQPLY
ncbi:MAG: DUF87 domain-containing protein [Bythopirellula sp.]|nr:DUF87 domain-containing protein [Bythopirellula sp.]